MCVFYLILDIWVRFNSSGMIVVEEVSGPEFLNKQRWCRKGSKTLLDPLWSEQGVSQSISGRRIHLPRWQVVSSESHDSLADSSHQTENQCVKDSKSWANGIQRFIFPGIHFNDVFTVPPVCLPVLTAGAEVVKRWASSLFPVSCQSNWG